MAKKYPKGMSEAEKLALSQKRRAAEKAAGVTPLTPSEQRAKDAAKRSEGVVGAVAPAGVKTGRDALIGAMTPKPKPPKKKRKR